MTRAQLKRIMREDAKRRNAQTISDAIALGITNPSSDTTIVNESAPGWRTPELHGATHVMPAPRRAYVDTVRTNALRNALKPRPSIAGSLAHIDACIIANPSKPQIHVNAVKVTRADGTTEIVPRSHYRRKQNVQHTRTNSAQNVVTNQSILRHNETAKLAPDTALADGTA